MIVAVVTALFHCVTSSVTPFGLTYVDRGGPPPSTNYGGGMYSMCPGGATWGNAGSYCINGNLHYCSVPGQPNPPLLERCNAAGCITNPPGIPDACIGANPPPMTCPGSIFWGNTGSYCINGNLYYCSAPGQPNPPLMERCNAGCATNPPGTPDTCHYYPPTIPPTIPPTYSTCPGGGYWGNPGSYCVNGNLHYCSAPGQPNPPLMERCNAGCVTNPPGIPDTCNVYYPTPSPQYSTCPGGGYWGNPGSYCINGNLHYCSSPGQPNPPLMEVCNAGCVTNPPGTPDRCNVYYPNPPTMYPPPQHSTCPGGRPGSTCVNGNLHYCSAPGQPNPPLIEVCYAGCVTNPQGISDSCYFPPTTIYPPPPTIYPPPMYSACPGGASWQNAGSYCMNGNLYYCSTPGQPNPPVMERCSAGCVINPPGVPDTCYFPSQSYPPTIYPPPPTIYPPPMYSTCPGAGYWGNPGSYCVNEDLYYCSAPGQPNPPLMEVCSAGCVTTPPGIPDTCTVYYPPTVYPPPVVYPPTYSNCPGAWSWGNPGSYCVNGDLYYCSAPGQPNPPLMERCSAGCVPNPPGIPDTCTVYYPPTISPPPVVYPPTIYPPPVVYPPTFYPPPMYSTCPGAGYWGNPGSYCINGNLYYCSTPGQPNPPLMEGCSAGCVPNPPGIPDTCTVYYPPTIYPPPVVYPPTIYPPPVVYPPTIYPPPVNYPPTCPTGLGWANAGGYCINNNLYYCSYQGQYNPTLTQTCNMGCVRNPPTIPDACASYP